MDNWPQLTDWEPLDIHLVTDGADQVAVTDQAKNVLIGPYSMKNRHRMQQLTDWVRDYILDTAKSPN